MKFVAGFILAPTVCGGLLREGRSIYSGSQVPPGKPHHAAQQDNKVSIAHSDIMDHAGRTTRRS